MDELNELWDRVLVAEMGDRQGIEAVDGRVVRLAFLRRYDIPNIDVSMRLYVSALLTKSEERRWIAWKRR